MKLLRAISCFRHSRKPAPLLAALALFCCALSLTACGLSRVDPISPDIHGIAVTPVQGVTSGRYYYERHDPQTEKWYEARELVPGWGLMVYTRDGKRELQKELDKDIK